MEITIWSKPACPACDRVKLLCDLHSLPYVERSLGINASKEDLLTAVPDARSVPHVFVDDKHVGGYQQFVAFLENTSQKL